MSSASSQIITLVSFHLSTHHLHLFFFTTVIMSQWSSQSLSLPPSLPAKVALSATVILINYHCRHVPVPESPRWQSLGQTSLFLLGRVGLPWNRQEVRDLHHPSAQQRWRQSNDLVPLNVEIKCDFKRSNLVLFGLKIPEVFSVFSKSLLENPVAVLR